MVQELAIDVADPAAMVQYLREMQDDEVASVQQAVLEVQPQFAYMEHGGGENPSAADLITRAMCERWKKQANDPPLLIQPRKVPEYHSQLGKAAKAADPASQRAEASGDRLESQTSSSTDDGPLHDQDLGGDEYHVTVQREEVVGDPARAVGDKARQRRKRRKERPVVSGVAEQLGHDGKWEMETLEMKYCSKHLATRSSRTPPC